MGYVHSVGRFIIYALASLLILPTLSLAANTVSLPSRKAEVVLPLLKQFSAKDGYSKILQILGKEDVDAGNAIKDNFYRLDNGTSIRVRSDGDKVFSIFHQGPNGIEVIFALDKTWEH